MKFKVVTAPLVEPISLEEAKEHLRVVEEDHDKYIERLIWAARESVENYLSRALITQTIELYLDNINDKELRDDDGNLILPRPPLQSIESFKYLDVSGALQTFTDYQVDSNREPGRIKLNTTPTVISNRLNAVTIRYKAGYGDKGENVPMNIRQGLLLTLAELFERREEAIVGVSMQHVIINADYILSASRIFY
jgi:uncharacterized phiE125 gp8 family phage protein